MSKRTYLISLVVILAAVIGTLFLAHRNGTAQSTSPLTPTSADISTSTQVDGFQVNEAPPPASLSATAHASATATTDVAPAAQNSYTVPVLADESALAAMQAYASSTPSFTFTGHNDPGLGFFVDSIGGKASADGSYWFLYINGTSSSLGASSAQVVPGDTVEWRYESSD